MPRISKEVSNICIKCKKETLDGEKVFWLGLEVPYVNLIMHRDCYNEIKDDILPFLQENLEEYLKMYKK